MVNIGPFKMVGFLEGEDYPERVAKGGPREIFALREPPDKKFLMTLPEIGKEVAICAPSQGNIYYRGLPWILITGSSDQVFFPGDVFPARFLRHSHPAGYKDESGRRVDNTPSDRDVMEAAIFQYAHPSIASLTISQDGICGIMSVPPGRAEEEGRLSMFDEHGRLVLDKKCPPADVLGLYGRERALVDEIAEAGLSYSAELTGFSVEGDRPYCERLVFVPWKGIEVDGSGGIRSEKFIE